MRGRTRHRLWEWLDRRPRRVRRRLSLLRQSDLHVCARGGVLLWGVLQRGLLLQDSLCPLRRWKRVLSPRHVPGLAELVRLQAGLQHGRGGHAHMPDWFRGRGRPRRGVLATLQIHLWRENRTMRLGIRLLWRELRRALHSRGNALQRTDYRLVANSTGYLSDAGQQANLHAYYRAMLRRRSLAAVR